MLSAFARQNASPDIDQAFINEQQNAVEKQCSELDNSRFGRVQEALLDVIYEDSAFNYGAYFASFLISISAERAKSFFTTNYVPGNAVLVIVGNFKEDDARKRSRNISGRSQVKLCVQICRSKINGSLRSGARS
jgi:predicted Zn-dependent peptidase